MNKTTKRKKAKRDNGNGSVYKLKNREYYCAAVMHGKKADGKPNMVRFYGKTEQEAKTKLNAFLLNPIPLEKASNKPILACDFIEHWLKDYKYVQKNFRKSSFDRLECSYRINIKPYLKGLQLSQVKPKHIEKIQNSANEKGLSLSSIQMVYKVLRRAFANAITKHLITENPFEETTLLQKKDVKKKVKKIRICSESQIEILLQTVDSFYNDTSSITYKYFSAFSFMAYSGLRAGEVLALKWDDLIEEEDGTFSIRVDENLVRSAVRDENLQLIGKRQSILGQPKTDAGFREVPLHPKALNSILQSKETNELYNITSEFIFATPENGHCTISRLQKSITNLIKLSGIGTNYGCHSFRHLFCSRLAHYGVQILEIAELAGHDDLKTTARYMHSTELRKRNAIKALI